MKKTTDNNTTSKKTVLIEKNIDNNVEVVEVGETVVIEKNHFDSINHAMGYLQAELKKNAENSFISESQVKAYANNLKDICPALFSKTAVKRVKVGLLGNRTERKEIEKSAFTNSGLETMAGVIETMLVTGATIADMTDNVVDIVNAANIKRAEKNNKQPEIITFQRANTKVVWQINYLASGAFSNFLEITEEVNPEFKATGNPEKDLLTQFIYTCKKR